MKTPAKVVIVDGVEMSAVGQTKEELAELNELCRLFDEVARKFVDMHNAPPNLAVAAMISTLGYWVAGTYPEQDQRDVVMNQLYENLRDAGNDWAAQLTKEDT